MSSGSCPEAFNAVQISVIMQANPIIAIVGAGAIGLFYGGRLARRGFNVHFLLRSDYEAIRQSGLSIQSVDGDFYLSPGELKIYKSPHEMPRADLVIVCLKTTSNADLPRLIPPLLRDDTAILTMQNGLGNEVLLAELFGESRVLGAMAFVCCNRIAPGIVNHIEQGFVRLGEFNRPAGARAKQIAQMFLDSGIDCQLLNDLNHGRWQKLVWNVPFNGLGALYQKTTEALLANSADEAEVRGLMGEIISTAESLGLRYPADLIERQIQLTRPMGRYKTSMQMDRESHRPMEIEAIIGQPLEIAHKHQVPTPLLATLYSKLRKID